MKATARREILSIPVTKEFEDRELEGIVLSATEEEMEVA